MLLSTCAGVALGDVDSPMNLTRLACRVKDCADFLAEKFGRFLQEKKLVDFAWRNTLDFDF
jgi:hypothetical protein